jgi:hypothetical protein
MKEKIRLEEFKNESDLFMYQFYFAKLREDHEVAILRLRKRHEKKMLKIDPNFKIEPIIVTQDDINLGLLRDINFLISKGGEISTIADILSISIDKINDLLLISSAS